MDLYALGAGIALFAGFIGCLIGFFIREKQQAVYVGNLQRRHEVELGVALASEEDAHERVEMLQNINQGQRGKITFLERCRSKRLDRLLELSAHLQESNKRLNRVIQENNDEWVDATSQRAKRLITRGVRKANKASRAKHERLMEIQVQKCKNTELILSMAEEEIVKQEKQIDTLKMEARIARASLNNIAKDKLALPGVRKAFIDAYWVERDRLRLVETNKGA